MMWLEALTASVLAVAIGGAVLLIGGVVWWQIEKRGMVRRFDGYITAWRARN